MLNQFINSLLHSETRTEEKCETLSVCTVYKYLSLRSSVQDSGEML